MIYYILRPCKESPAAFSTLSLSRTHPAPFFLSLLSIFACLHICLSISVCLLLCPRAKCANQHSQSDKQAGLNSSVCPLLHATLNLTCSVLTASDTPLCTSIPPSSSGLLTTGASSTSVAMFSNWHVSNYHMRILKMAQPFIVDMHAHTHPWDVCYWADLQYSIFVPRMEQFWAQGLSWCSRV